MVGDLNTELGHVCSRCNDDFNAPQVDSPAASNIVDFLCKNHMFLPCTYRELHSANRATHFNHIHGPRRIDYVALPNGWRSAVTTSDVDMTMDMLAASDDHFMPTVVIEGYFGCVANEKKGQLRVTAKYVASCDLDSQDIFWQAVNKIEVPTWYVDVHTHKHLVSRQVHEAAALLVPPERKQLKAYADEIVIACSKTRKWYLHSRDRFLRDARRYTISRFFLAWRSKQPVDVFFSTNVLAADEWFARCSAGWFAQQLQQSLLVQKQNIDQAKIRYLRTAPQHVLSNRNDVWNAVSCFRKGSSAKIVSSQDGRPSDDNADWSSA